MKINPERTIEICSKATEGPWDVYIETERDGEKEHPLELSVSGFNKMLWSEDWSEESEWDQCNKNADFISHARAQLSAYAEWVKRAKPLLERLIKVDIETCEHALFPQEKCSVCIAKKLLEEVE